ncbi:MAG: hypothetical protein N3A69_03160 [Leptospiraceae bacterium]|nr:hypothetical protein [Leptospiraceae bacterium]
MRAFHTIAVPHKDILEGRLDQSLFAADLWEAYNNRGKEEYRDAKLFFQKTYLTEGLKNLLEMIENSLKGNGKDKVVHIQTPFGGGKTHSLIALMHKAKEWQVSLSVIVGTNLGATEKLWEILEKQLTGKVEILKSDTSPGKTKLKEVLEKKTPFLILMDEVLEYIVKASGVKVGDSNLGAQTLAFLQELTEAVQSERGCLVVTLPSSNLEKFDQNAQNASATLEKILGRVENITTPVNDNEVAKVIQKRLFQEIKKEAEEIVNEFVDYISQENLLPSNVERSVYREKFLNSYPFLPEVIEVLYHRWGSLAEFQRTRGVLRILGLVVSSLKDKPIPYISLADFDLSNPSLRQELIKYIGQEYNSVLSQDILNQGSGCKKVEKNLADSYRGSQLGTRVGVASFLYSFSGGTEKGVTLQELQRVAAIPKIPSSVIFETIGKLASELFYFQFKNDKYFFENKPNLNKVILDKKENVSKKEILELEKELLQKNLSGKYFKIYLWEKNSENIADTEDLKLIILQESDLDVMQQIVSKKGNFTRIHCNTLFFLYPLESSQTNLQDTIKTYLAYKSLEEDTTLNLDDSQKKYIQAQQKTLKENLNQLIQNTYQMLVVPKENGLEKDNLGTPTFGDISKLDERVYQKLKGKNIAENLSPVVIQDKYLKNKNQEESIYQILQSFYRTPGEIRVLNREVFRKALQEGVEKEIFGVARKEGETLKPLRANEIELLESEVLIPIETYKSLISTPKEKPEVKPLAPTPEPTPQDTPFTPTPPHLSTKKEVKLEFSVPKGKVYEIAKMLHSLHEKFQTITLTIHSIDGSITTQDYENQILETLKQLGIQYREE